MKRNSAAIAGHLVEAAKLIRKDVNVGGLEALDELIEALENKRDDDSRLALTMLYEVYKDL